MGQQKTSTAAQFGASSATNAKTSPGNLFSVHATNANAAVRYLLIFNTASVPSGNTNIRYSFPIPAGTANQPGAIVIGTEFFGDEGQYFSNGIGYGISSVNGTLAGSSTTPSDHTTHLNVY